MAVTGQLIVVRVTKFWGTIVLKKIGRGIPAAGIIFVAGMGGAAHALQFEIGDLYGSMENTFTLGAAWRMEERDPSLIGKINLQPGLCTLSNYTDNPDFSQGVTYADAATYEERGLIGNTCNSTSDPSFNNAYVNAPGSFNINGDDGNLNFDRGDIVSAAAKMNTNLKLNWGMFDLQVRGIWMFNDTYVGFDETHPDTTLRSPTSALADDTVDQFGTHFELEDAVISTSIPLFDREIGIRLGRQGFIWGESNALPLNSINTVNPPDQVRQRTPGFDLSELFQPVGMLYAGVDLTLNLFAEVFYQYEWVPVRVDAPGTYFSVSDILGGSDDGGQFAMLSFGKAPEDPYQIYSSQDNGEDPFALGSAGSRTVYRKPDVKPKDGGQFGFALKYFAENFNNGTEVGFYYTNTHSRIPSVSFQAAQPSCATDSTNVIELAVDCGAGLGEIGTLRLSEEPLPVDTVRLFAEYPENRHMLGVSFNTTIGDFAWAGEYTFRPNHPVQIHTVDLIFAALQPAFPKHNINVGLPADLSLIDPGVLDQLDPLILPALQGLAATGLPATVLPGRRMAVPDYVQTIYRGEEVTPGMYIRGYEELKQGQFVTSLLRTFGAASNPFGADQVLMLAEFGLTHIIDMPGLDQIQFQGGGTDTHASSGADGTTNSISDSAAQTNGTVTDGDGDIRCVRQAFDTIGGAEAEPCRQNPTAQDPNGFGDELSYGIRILTLTKYQDFIMGWNFEPLVALFYDIEGIAPGLGQNFQEGRITGLLGFRFDYQSRWFTELRYTYLDGDLNPIRDRDNLMFTLQYTF
ncbi:MAG: DUF1302 domain-containing protein [Oceanococcus sp.]